MTNQSYNTNIEVTVDPTDVFDRINDVPKWFKNKGFEGPQHKIQ